MLLNWLLSLFLVCSCDEIESGDGVTILSLLQFNSDDAEIEKKNKFQVSNWQYFNLISITFTSILKYLLCFKPMLRKSFTAFPIRVMVESNVIDGSALNRSILPDPGICTISRASAEDSVLSKIILASLMFKTKSSCLISLRFDPSVTKI